MQSASATANRLGSSSSSSSSCMSSLSYSRFFSCSSLMQLWDSPVVSTKNSLRSVEIRSKDRVFVSEDLLGEGGYGSVYALAAKSACKSTSSSGALAGQLNYQTTQSVNEHYVVKLFNHDTLIFRVKLNESQIESLGVGNLFDRDLGDASEARSLKRSKLTTDADLAGEKVEVLKRKEIVDALERNVLDRIEEAKSTPKTGQEMLSLEDGCCDKVYSEVEHLKHYYADSDGKNKTVEVLHTTPEIIVHYNAEHYYADIKYRHNKVVVMPRVLGTKLLDYPEKCFTQPGYRFKRLLQLMSNATAKLKKWHKKGKLHLDLSSSNIMVDTKNEDAVELIDFGMSVWFCDQDGVALDRSKVTVKRMYTDQDATHWRSDRTAAAKLEGKQESRTVYVGVEDDAFTLVKNFEYLLKWYPRFIRNDMQTLELRTLLSRSFEQITARLDHPGKCMPMIVEGIESLIELSMRLNDISQKIGDLNTDTVDDVKSHVSEAQKALTRLGFAFLEPCFDQSDNSELAICAGASTLISDAQSKIAEFCQRNKVIENNDVADTAGRPAADKLHVNQRVPLSPQRPSASNKGHEASVQADKTKARLFSEFVNEHVGKENNKGAAEKVEPNSSKNVGFFAHNPGQVATHVVSQSVNDRVRGR